MDDLVLLTRRLANRERELLRFWNLSKDLFLILVRPVGSEDPATIIQANPAAQRILGAENLEGVSLQTVTVGRKIPLEWSTSEWIPEGPVEKCYAVARVSNGSGGESMGVKLRQGA